MEDFLYETGHCVYEKHTSFPRYPYELASLSGVHMIAMSNCLEFSSAKRTAFALEAPVAANQAS